MKLLVISAARGIGRNRVEPALDQEHAVASLVRNPRRLDIRQEQLTVVAGDILDPAAVRTTGAFFRTKSLIRFC
jgi:putative NADH-flavin reductase